MKTKTAEQKKAFRQYLLSCINPENYEVICSTDRERLEFVQTTFEKEYGYEIARLGYQRAFEEWLKGLPSSFNVDFENYRIIELAKEFGFISVNATTRQEDNALKYWWGGVYVAFNRMLMDARKLPRLTVADIKRLTAETAPYFFDSKTLKFFKQRVSDFKVTPLHDQGRYYLYAPAPHGMTERYFNPANNQLELK